MSTRRDSGKTRKKSKTTNEEFNSSSLKTLDLENNSMEPKRTSDYQPNNNKSSSMKSTSTNKNWLKTTLNLKLTEWRFKNFSVKTINLEIKSETPKKTSGCQPHKLVNSTLNLKSPATSMKNSKESFNNLVVMPRRKLPIMNPRLGCSHKNFKDSTVSLRERTTKSELWEVKFRVLKKISDSQQLKLPNSLNNLTNTKFNSKTIMLSPKPIV